MGGFLDYFYAYQELMAKRESNVTAAPWKTCADQWAQDLQKQQEQFAAAAKRDATREQMKACFEEMLEEDNFFLRLLISDFQERLGK